jgi:enoyl-CoA hydratase
MRTNYTNILYEIKGSPVVKIIINRSEVLNAIDYPTIVALKEILSDIATNDDVKIVVITGAGKKSFSVGADQQEIKLHTQDEQRAMSFEKTGREAINMVEGLGKPSICAINGYAFGMGVQLALACTFRIVSSNAKFGFPEINMGFFPAMGATQRLTRLVGEAKATEMILMGETIDADEAFRIGLVHKVVPQTELSEMVDRMSVDLSQKNHVVVKLAMDAIHEGRDMSLPDGLAYEAKLAEYAREVKTLDKTVFYNN